MINKTLALLVVMSTVVLAALFISFLWLGSKDSNKKKNSIEKRNISASNNNSLNNENVKTQEALTEATVNEENNEVESWQSYTSKDFDYSIKFPTSLYHKGNKVQSFPGQFKAQDLIISDIEKMGVQDVMPNEKIHITVTINKKSASQTLQEYLRNQGIPDDYQIKEIILNNVKAYSIKPSAKQPSISIFTEKNDVVYHIHGINYLDESANSENFKFMHKIIETFKFTE